MQQNIVESNGHLPVSTESTASFTIQSELVSTVARPGIFGY